MLDLHIDDIQSRIESPDNLCNRMQRHRLGSQGRYEGSKDIPIEIKKVVALLENEEETKQTTIAKEFGIGQGTVSKISSGIASGFTPDPLLVDVMAKVGKKKKDVADRAIDALLESLQITSHLLPEVRKAKEASSIAKDLSAIVKDMSGDSEVQKNVVLHLFAPDMKKVGDYETIEV